MHAPNTSLSPPTAILSITRVTGHFLIRNHLSRRERAALAVRMFQGLIKPESLTLTQSLTLWGVTYADVRALRRNDNGGNGYNGGKKQKPTLADRLAHSTADERIEAARALGVEVVWDTMVAPLVT